MEAATDATPKFHPIVPFWPYSNNDFLQPIDFAGDLAKLPKTWHCASEIRIFAL
jgi:hypothetical protein